jgi:hypothetical protein
MARTKVRCTACGSDTLTHVSSFDDTSGYSHVVFLDGSADERRFRVDRARVCLDCGHVMLAMSPRTLAELRAERGSLRPAGVTRGEQEPTVVPSILANAG